MKFKILPKVDGFRDAQGILHLPGDIIDLPEAYLGETWLRKQEPEKPKPAQPTSKAEATPEPKPETAPETPFTPAPLIVPLAEKKPSKRMKPNLDLPA